MRAYLNVIRRCVDRGPFQEEARELQAELLDDADSTIEERLERISTRPANPFERYLHVKATVTALKEPVRLAS